MRKNFGFALALLAALVVYNIWSAYSSTHMLIRGELDGFSFYRVSQVWSPISGTSDDYALYVYELKFVTDGESWTEDRILGEMRTGDHIAGIDPSDHPGDIDGEPGTHTMLVAVCAPAGLKTAEEVHEYGWALNDRGPSHNDLGFDFYDPDTNWPYYEMLTCGK